MVLGDILTAGVFGSLGFLIGSLLQAGKVADLEAELVSARQDRDAAERKASEDTLPPSQDERMSA